jgi:hypothetical protein
VKNKLTLHFYIYTQMHVKLLSVNLTSGIQLNFFFCFSIYDDEKECNILHAYLTCIGIRAERARFSCLPEAQTLERQG